MVKNIYIYILSGITVIIFQKHCLWAYFHVALIIKLQGAGVSVIMPVVVKRFHVKKIQIECLPFKNPQSALHHMMWNNPTVTILSDHLQQLLQDKPTEKRE